MKVFKVWNSPSEESTSLFESGVGRHHLEPDAKLILMIRAKNASEANDAFEELLDEPRDWPVVLSWM